MIVEFIKLGSPPLWSDVVKINNEHILDGLDAMVFFCLFVFRTPQAYRVQLRIKNETGVHFEVKQISQVLQKLKKKNIAEYKDGKWRIKE